MGHDHLDPGAVRRTELILDALAARRDLPGKVMPPGAAPPAADPALDLLAALAADVEQDLPAGSWLASPWLAAVTRLAATGRPAAPGEPGGRRRMRAAIAVSAAAMVLASTVVLRSQAGAGLPGPFGWLGGAPQATGGHAGVGTSAARPRRPAANRARWGQGPLAALPGIWLPVAPGPTWHGTAQARHR